MKKANDKGRLFDDEVSCTKAAVECLGRTFESDEARRSYFLDRLRAGLEELEATLGRVPFTSVEDAFNRMKSIEKWPMGDEAGVYELAQRMRHGDAGKDLLERWKDEVGFPHGKIEDILTLSDPPYYTACPNPFIGEFVLQYGKPYEPATDNYRREPFAADVSEGKNDPIYNAHSYHTKVPHKAIMRYILHYTEPGDLVFDGFCGTGMTGVAAQLCGDKAVVESLGYKVDEKGVIYQPETREEADGKTKTVWIPFSKLGARRAILNDLSPAATFIAYNYNTPVDVEAFEREAKRILKEVEDECGWMYATLAESSGEGRGVRSGKGIQGMFAGMEADMRDGDDDGQADMDALARKVRSAQSVDELRAFINKLRRQGSRMGTINYTVWSDVFVCPECAHEVIFWEAAVDKEKGQVHDEFPCPHCGAALTKRRMERAWVTKFDKAIGQTVRQAKQVPVLINYSLDKKRYEKEPDAFDLALIEKIEESDIPYWFPTARMPEGDESRRNDDIGITHVHHFYTKRNLWVTSKLWHMAGRSSLLARKRILFWLQSVGLGQTRLNRFLKNAFSQVNRTLSGTLYVSSAISEVSPRYALSGKIKCLLFSLGCRLALANTASAHVPAIAIPRVDYIFIDPPFGGNIMYSELNFLWEAWLKVFTNNDPEAVENETQHKGLMDYQQLMTRCFQEYYRVLKPGRWMTVEFHNSQNRVWNAIQQALQAAGFVVADVRTLDKKQGTFKQVTSAGAVKQDIIISCYKPNGGLEQRFKLTAGTEEGVWDFVRTHLKQLPVFVSKNGKAEVIAERLNYLLFDRMVAFHVRRGVTVPLTAVEFYRGLAQRFPERDGMYFLPDQVAEYDRKRVTVREVLQLSLFVTDESSAIQWLKQQLTKKPQTFQEIHPQFLREIGGWQKHEKPLELRELLEQNFLMYDGKGPIPPQIVAWMKQSERLRKLIQEEIAVGRATEDLVGLVTQNPELIAAARDRWYVPDPNKAGDLEKVRERALLREFEEYRASPQRRLRVFRMEAVRAGFKKAWQEKDYATIIAVAEKIPDNVLREDDKLLMWYDQAVTRMGMA